MTKRRTFLACALAVLLLGFDGRVVCGQTTRGVEIHTRHYDLYTEFPNGAEQGQMLDQLYDQLTKFFGAAPDGPLRAKAFASKASCLNGIKADGVNSKSQYGCYLSDSRTFYVYPLTPLRHEMENGILHEATHQFHA